MLTATKRLFLALPIPEPIATQVVDWRDGLAPTHRGKPVAKANLHITLCFLSEVHQPLEQQLVRRLNHLDSPRFTVRLDSCGCFTRSAILYLAPTQAEPALLTLAADCRNAAQQAGIQLQQPSYRPHLSLYRRAKTHALPPPPQLALGV